MYLTWAYQHIWGTFCSFGSKHTNWFCEYPYLWIFCWNWNKSGKTINFKRHMYMPRVLFWVQNKVSCTQQGGGGTKIWNLNFFFHCLRTSLPTNRNCYITCNKHVYAYRVVYWYDFWAFRANSANFRWRIWPKLSKGNLHTKTFHLSL